MFYRLIATINSVAPTVLRLLLAGVFTIHGGQHTIGWLGGAGWTGTLAQWTAPATDGYHFPYSLAAAGILTEVLGAVGLLLGFMTRLAAGGLFCLMTVAVLFDHAQSGFFAPKGYEYPLTLAGVALALMCCGGGRFSVDRLISSALLPPNSGRLGSYLDPLN